MSGKSGAIGVAVVVVGCGGGGGGGATNTDTDISRDNNLKGGSRRKLVIIGEKWWGWGEWPHPSSL